MTHCAKKAKCITRLFIEKRSSYVVNFMKFLFLCKYVTIEKSI